MKLLSKKSKGMLILSLILLAKNSSSSDGASFFDYSQRARRRAENLFDKKSRRQGPGGGSSPRPTARLLKEFPAECPNSTPRAADGACSASPKPTFPLPRLLPLTGIFPRARSFLSSRSGKVRTVKRFAEDCCVDCSQCMDPKTFAAKCQEIPRGGSNLDPLSQAATAATAATMTAPYGIPLNAWKVIFQALLTTMNVFCWLIPLRSKKISENKLALSLANAFSAGVFLSLAFGHLIPECVEGFAEVASENLSHTTPYMLVLVGYLLIFFVEKVAFDHDDLMGALGPGSESESSQSESLLSHGSSHESQRQLKAQENGVDHQQATETGSSSGRSALILLGALAIHSVLEMMALGLSRNFGDCALLTLSIALHQPAESIALLVAFLKSGMPKEEIFQFLAVFSCMGPIGVLLGMIVSEFAAPIVESVMLAIVAGTFVYVGATEVIPEEWEDSENKWKKFLALMSGIVTIMVITQYTMSLENSVSNAAAEALIL